MKVFLVIWQALRLVGNMSVCMAAFLLWSAIAAGAGWLLVHLPDVWYEYLGNQSSTYFSVAAITAYAFVAGTFFLEFSCGVLQMLADAYNAIRLFTRRPDARRAVSIVRRHQPLLIRKVRLEPICVTSQARGTSENIPTPATAGMLERQRTAQAEAVRASARTDSRPT